MQRYIVYNSIGTVVFYAVTWRVILEVLLFLYYFFNLFFYLFEALWTVFSCFIGAIK